MDKDSFLIATVELFDQPSGAGLAWYTVDNIHYSVQFTLTTCDALEVSGSCVNWAGTFGYSPTGAVLNKGNKIAVGEIDDRGRALMWTTESELDRQLLDAQSSYYSIHRNGECIWSGGLTYGAEPKIHSRTGSHGFPKELTEDMWIEVCAPHDEEFSGGWEFLPEQELIQVWMRMQRATWVSSPHQQVRSFIAA